MKKLFAPFITQLLLSSCLESSSGRLKSSSDKKMLGLAEATFRLNSDEWRACCCPSRVAGCSVGQAGTLVGMGDFPAELWLGAESPACSCFREFPGVSVRQGDAWVDRDDFQAQLLSVTRLVLPLESRLEALPGEDKKMLGLTGATPRLPWRSVSTNSKETVMSVCSCKTHCASGGKAGNHGGARHPRNGARCQPLPSFVFEMN
jgi:hypothetical protein